MDDKKAAILESGRKLFSTRGFKDTNVAEITKTAGIATGTFYIYYSSKDKLFMDIYLEENAKLKRSIIETLDLERSPMEIMQQMMLLNYRGMLANPILKEWYNKDVYNKLERAFREEKGMDSMAFLNEGLAELVKRWQADGKMRKDIAADMILAIFSALLNVETHKEEIGIKYFPELLGYLAEFTMKGLMDGPEKKQRG